MASEVIGIGIAGTELSDAECELLRERPPGAIVLFARNIASPDQLRRLTDSIRTESSAPVLLMIDEEGGRVDRLRSMFDAIPGAYRYQESANAEELALEGGRLVGAFLRYFDIDVNLAPVVDIERETPSPGLERRCFGRDASTVTRLAGAFLDGLHASGVAGCLKHFPGIGAGSSDTHYGTSIIEVSREELNAMDLAPYAALGARAGAVMIGHGTYPALPDPKLPASLNVEITRRMLRRDLAFDGLIVSDDMEMHAVADLGSLEEAAERALVAGNDIVLFCAQTEKMRGLIDVLERHVEDEPALDARIDDARMRISQYREHVEQLRRDSDRYELPHLVRWLAEFRKRMDAEAPEESAFEATTPGTGRTGREEWT